MKRLPLSLISIIFLIQLACKSEKIEQKRFFEMTNFEIDSLLRVMSNKNLTITERINLFSERFLGTSYNFQCVGDGPYALIENWPLVNFKETNCMALCEHVLALSISDSWDNFFNNLQHIRYRDGIIGMRTRNHYTMADWLPENRWLLEDVSKKVGGKYAKSVTRTISHQAFFKNKGIDDLRYTLPDRELTIDYVPKENLLNIEKNLREGDILSLIFADRDDIFSAHMLIVARKGGNRVIREASSSRMTTFDTHYKEWAEKIQQSERYIGIAVMRVKDELNKPNKVILPWEIKNMK